MFKGFGHIAFGLTAFSILASPFTYAQSLPEDSYGAPYEAPIASVTVTAPKESPAPSSAAQKTKAGSRIQNIEVVQKGNQWIVKVPWFLATTDEQKAIAKVVVARMQDRLEELQSRADDPVTRYISKVTLEQLVQTQAELESIASNALTDRSLPSRALNTLTPKDLEALDKASKTVEDSSGISLNAQNILSLKKFFTPSALVLSIGVSVDKNILPAPLKSPVEFVQSTPGLKWMMNGDKIGMNLGWIIMPSVNYTMSITPCMNPAEVNQLKDIAQKQKALACLQSPAQQMVSKSYHVFDESDFVAWPIVGSGSDTIGVRLGVGMIANLEHPKEFAGHAGLAINVVTPQSRKIGGMPTHLSISAGIQNITGKKRYPFIGIALERGTVSGVKPAFTPFVAFHAEQVMNYVSGIVKAALGRAMQDAATIAISNDSVPLR